MSDPYFDLNFLGGGGSSTSATTNLPMHSALDQYGMLMNPGLGGLGGTTSSIFAPLTTTTSSLEGLGGTGPSIFAPLTGAQTTAQQSSVFEPITSTSAQSSSTVITRSSSMTDYSSHFSAEYAQNTHQDTSAKVTGQTTATTDSAQYNSQQNDTQVKSEAEATTDSDQPVQALDIVINNVVCSFSTRCHLNLKRIAREGMHVVFKPENGMVSMKLRKPYTTANMWSSGKITVTGSNSEDDAKIAARRYSRILQKMGFRVRFGNYRVVNVLGTCSFPFGIRITHLSRDHSRQCSYEPELHPGATYTIKEPKATLKVFSTGSITVTAPRVENVQLAIQHIWPIAYQYRMDSEDTPRSDASKTQLYTMAGDNTRVSQYSRKRKRPKVKAKGKIHYYVEDSDGEVWSDTTDCDDSDEDDEEDVE